MASMAVAITVPVVSMASKPRSRFALRDRGLDKPVDYSKFGVFENSGSEDYRYVITDEEGLSNAVGIGIFPNETSVLKDKRFKKLTKLKKLQGNLPEFTPEKNAELAFYKWASTRKTNTKGLRLFNIAQSLERLGHNVQALKAYYAVVVHFPKEINWSSGRPWYIGPAALDSVHRLLREHANEWQWKLEGARIDVENGFDKKGTNDKFVIHPGRWSKGSPLPVRQHLAGVKAEIGGDKVKLVQYANNHWQLLVEGRPFIVRGMCYVPSPVGKSPDWGGYRPHLDWMSTDSNQNGRVDGPYDAWVDLNNNKKQDKNEPSVGDFELMRQMGVNTVRLYHHVQNKALLRDLHERFGIRSMVGDLLGAYALGSGADWDEGTDYSNPVHLANMRQSVMHVIENNKDEDFVLMWVLGNENNYGRGTNADRKPLPYYKFANEMAKLIHDLDPLKRPVVLCNGDLENLEMITAECPDVDVLGLNAYRGASMGESFWRGLQRVWKKPVVITEFGCPALNVYTTREEAENEQAYNLLGNWSDILDHTAGTSTGNCFGGFVFEWLDEWWKAGPHYEAWIQDTDPQSKGPFPDGNMYEEWLGILSQGDGELSPYLRRLRPAYHAFKNGPWKSNTDIN